MTMRLWVTAGLLGLALGASIGTAPAMAQVLRVQEGQADSTLQVPMNRAVVVESDIPFAELSVANPGIADIATLSDRSIYVLGKSQGRTTMTLLGADGRLITNVDVQVTPDIAEFKERLEQILPGENIEVRTANDGVVLSGTASSVTAMDRALDLAQRYAPDRVSNLMSIGGSQQVMLKVRFAEMQRSVSKQLSGGLTAIYSGTDGAFSVGLGSGGLTDGGSIGGANSTEFTLNPEAAGTIGLGFNIGNVSLGILLEALESKGVVRTLAEPNLTTLSGQEASFLAGGEYPIPVADGDGGISVEYKPFGVELDFIPTVLDDDVINLELGAAVSALDSSASIITDSLTVQGFSRRETLTTVQLRDGDSFAIAGLLEDDFRDFAGQVPWLGDIPVLGALFRSADYARSQSELVIIVTAHLVSPTRGEALVLPTDRVRIPSEREFFLNGNLVREDTPRRGAAGEVAQQDFSGSYGYVLE
ncbi:type II and III secretion system protein [Dinoroseobacter shibae DFL 12 = DSM 16493]|uniref:Type II and III secretion system protein n=1 Tax=Dinoroseobacter shibae (strain DSM 16493 / NCIMB 14021 / DFL 12) TaxID=398580 RepID=A8LHS4_DINSH|nr:MULTISPECIES: type II and III secretion system protein family protein [Dinoroseobacter]ABV92871.1 type II and III secretion system protein [Dinoroseobacter shibae DFL 12 = DSM 16493]MDD9715971.1 type II and III secretion system protein family protein [Dinoroseobacter sp. PD6]URF47807.1 type II and III secretion system protein family protein [Dinoroseobacter shibae]URF52117.1 type II and III secretion system protein family protein [Dinoroseobacter shibae]